MPQIEWNGHHGPSFDKVGEFTVIDCDSCGFKHVIPIPTCDDLEATYRQEYYTREKPLYLERHREDQDWWNLAYGDRYDFFERELPSGRRRILDVGSGPGFFLLHGRNRGWEAYGLEPSVHAAAHSRSLGLEILEEFLTAESVATLGTFDVVHLSEMLEHVPDPATMLRHCAALLEPDGLICIVVPNDYSPFQQALRKGRGYQPWWVAPPHHLNYFSFDSLERLLERCGFQICLRETTFPIDMFLLMGDDYVGNDQLGRACHVKRMTFERNLASAGLNDIKRRLYRALAAEGLGREIVMVGRKK